MKEQQRYWRVVQGERETGIYMSDEKRIEHQEHLKKQGLEFVPIPEGVYQLAQKPNRR